MKYSDLATKYNVSISDIRRAEYDFVQNEGFMPDGREADNLLEWLDMYFSAPNPLDNQSPFQKGDRNYGL